MSDFVESIKSVLKRPKVPPPKPDDQTTIGTRGHREETGKFSDGKDGDWKGEIGKKWDETF